MTGEPIRRKPANLTYGHYFGDTILNYFWRMNPPNYSAGAPGNI